MGSKIKYDEVKEAIESENWTLISKEYKNLKTGLELNCPNGHMVNFTFDSWRKAKVHECPICIQQSFIKMNEMPKRKKGGTYRILAIDQASNTSGWSILDNGELINYGTWSSSGTHSTEKISQMKMWMASMIDRHLPDLICLEDIQLQKFDGGEAVTTYKKLAHLQGVLKNYCYEHGVPYKIIPPATWRQYSDIKGKTRTDRKKSAQLKVQSIYNINASEDEADAILIGRYAAAEEKRSKMVTF